MTTAPSSDGAGARINSSESRVTVIGSTFSGNTSGGGGGALAIFGSVATLSGDTFTGNSTGAAGQGGGISLDLSEAGSSIASSTFTGNKATGAGGGAVVVTTVKGGVGLTLTGNTFARNIVADPAGTATTSGIGYGGGGLYFFGGLPTMLVQSGNTFDSNSVSFKPAPISSFGGGEDVIEAELLSTADRFTSNTLQSPSEATNSGSKKHVFGWGAGLSIAECGELAEPPLEAPNLVSSLSDDVIAGNTLQSGPSASGAGVYVGFTCASGSTTLGVSDSTISGNVISGTTGGSAAGISGGPKDVLSLANTIVAGDSGNGELGGFGGLSAVTATYSDVCSGSAPFGGAGNICADPKLVGAGPGSADVHETAASPTVDAGSNALVPSNLTTDAFGSPRVLGPIGCATPPPRTVDIGAAEFKSDIVPPCVHILSALVPGLSSLGQTAKTWREGKLLAQLSRVRPRSRKAIPIGTNFSFKLTEAAQVTFKFTTLVKGRKAGNKCVAQTRHNRSKHACKRTITAGVLTLSGHAGTNKVRFQGLLAKHRRLAAGRSYMLLAVASAAGQHSATRTLKFTIAR